MFGLCPLACQSLNRFPIERPPACQVPAPGQLTARVGLGGEPLAELTITDHSWKPVAHLYQAFIRDEQGTYLAHITMEGEQSEHEEESGRIRLHPHPFNKDLVISEIYEQPFREMWMRNGVQTFEPLVQLQTA